MKQRSREFNVFSISALDLFASALGAFILISIVLMPYFLNVEPDEVNKLKRALAESQRQLQQSQAKLRQSQTKAAQLQRKVQQLVNSPKYQFPDLDIVIALDTTGSMGREIASLRDEIVDLTRVLQRLTPSLGVGIVGFKDRCDRDSMIRRFPLQRVNSATLPRLVNFTKTMARRGKCNRGAEEALAEALDASVAMPWRKESKARVIVIVTDNPPYADMEAHALNAARGAASRNPPVKTSTVYRNTGKYSKSSTPGYLRRLAEAGRGQYVPHGSAFFASILLALMT